ncbi:MAG: FecR family protein [Janthinobacterium lividum]
MPQKTVTQLLALKLSGEATAKDLAELEDLMAKNSESVYHEELLRQLFLNKEEEPDTEYQYNLHRLKYQNKLIFAEENVTAFNHLKIGRYIVAACSLVLISIVARLFIAPNKYDKNSTIFNTEVIAGKAVRKKIILPDGTQVWLNSESKLVYDKDMGKRNIREVQLTGEAFFDVTHNKRRPFIINTDKISVKVLGTAFNIKAYPKDQKTETTLLRGSIELTVNNHSAEKVVLKPTEKFALIDRKVKITNSTKPDQTADITMMVQNVLPIKVAGKEYSEEVSWVDNQLVFSNESFEELAPKLERWYNVKLNIQNSHLDTYHFSGVFTNENLVEALTALKLIKPFNFKIEMHDVTIY